VLDKEAPDHLEFTTPILLFFFINPFALITRAVIRVEKKGATHRLVYDLKHPVDILFILAGAPLMFSNGAMIWPFGLMFPLYALLHSGMLYFMHRDILQVIAGGRDRGDGLLHTARPQG
jgi:hypothetical protein